MRHALQGQLALNDFEVQYLFAEADGPAEATQASKLKNLDHPVENMVNFPSQCINAIHEEDDSTHINDDE